MGLQETKSNTKDKDVYLIAFIKSEKKIDFKDIKLKNIKPQISPKIIFNKRIAKENGAYIEEFVFKFKIKNEKEKKEKVEEENKYNIKFIIGEYKYIISFNDGKNTFIYLTELKARNIYRNDILGEVMDQNSIPFHIKLNIFLEALEKNNENKKKTKLYEDTINLYSKEKKFNLLIYLFLNIYEKYINLCNKLIEMFCKINKQENKDREVDLKKGLTTFKKIFSKSEDIIKKNKYNPIYFYGILLCYLHYYDNDNFLEVLDKFSQRKMDILYNILIKYYSHFMYPLKQSQNFYNGFIKYVLKKKYNYKIFRRALNYIEDIETFLFVIIENKEEILKNYDKLKEDPIKMNDSLKLSKYKKTNTKIIIKHEKEKKTDRNSDNGLEHSDEEKILDKYDTLFYLIEKIIEFSEKERVVTIYMKSTFWKYLINEFIIPDLENIDKLYKLRELYKKYNNLINLLYIEDTKDKKSQDDDNNIKIDINRYYDKDEFAFILNKNIKAFLELNKNIADEEILGIVERYNPYFSNRDKTDNERYKNNREPYFFDYINFSKITSTFIENFRHYNFEEIFKENINDFINKITEKINDIQTFGNIIKLITVDRIKDEKQKNYFRILKEKYNLIIKNEIILIKSEDKLKKVIKIIADFVSLLFLFEKNNSFLDDEISNLDDKIKFLVHIKLIEAYNDKIYEQQKHHIYDIYLEKINVKEGRDNIIKLIKQLSDNNKNFFICEKILEKCKFTKEEFFSNQENYKIKTLCLLNKELFKESKYYFLEQKEKGNKNFDDLEYILDNINRDLEYGRIIKKDLEKFLNIERKKSEEDVIEKLGLITLIISDYDPIKKFEEYKSNIYFINEKVKKLIYIKDSLMIFHRKIYIKDIQAIIILIDEIENAPIRNFKYGQMRESIEHFLMYDYLCQEINMVKDFILFKTIFKNEHGRDQAERFNNSIKCLRYLKKNLEENKSNIENVLFNDKKFAKIFNDIKEELSKKDESISNKLIEQMIDYFNINNSTMKKDLEIIIKSKKYEMIIKSIKYFFDNFLNKKLILPKDINLSKMSLIYLKQVLNQLKRDSIYDYESRNTYYRVFISFYEKKEAIDFLFSIIKENDGEFSNKLKDKLDPTYRSISIKDIDDTIKCLNHFRNLIDKNSSEIINYIKSLDEETIKIFENYSKKYCLIMELNNKNEKDKFEDIYQIIQDANFIFNLDNEKFSYKINEEIKQIENIEELIKLKNKINIQHKKKEIYEEIEKNPFEIKCDILLLFKEVVSNLEIIYDKMNILRREGFNIPIIINIEIKYPNVKYKLNDQEKEFNEIKDYLLNIKNDYENQLSIIYEKEKYLRLLYGKLFRKIRQHQEGNDEISDIMRYILNKTSIYDTIRDADNLHISPLDEDYEEEYHVYTKEIFIGISSYLISLFKNNNLDFQKHYENMEIKREYNNKGFLIKKCQNESMEEYILNLFMDKLGKFPIAQNILICSEQTSVEEIQSFLYRAILCEYNTLFVIQILESFSNYQFNKMYNYIDKIFSIKLEKYNKEKRRRKNYFDKSKSRNYLDSYIVFVYECLENEFSLKNQLEKYSEKENEKNDKSNFSNLSCHSKRSIIENDILKNIKVISSDVCGLGKSFKIKKMIKEEGKIYYYFPLGGKLTKNIIYQKILGLFEKIKKDAKTIKEANKKLNDYDDNSNKGDEEYSEFNNVAIHLDLLETREINLINEFLFSFLITKFYTNNGNIIYIPSNLKIYIEVANSDENYIYKFGILNVLDRENIVQGELNQNEKNNVKMLPLELESNIRKKFKALNGIEDNKEIEQFIKKYIGIKEYSYHQVQIFIKLYISQFDSLENILKPNDSQDKNATKKCIEYFAKISASSANGGFSKVMMEKQDKKYTYEELLYLNPYESDLKGNFDIPLIYLDESTKKIRFEKLLDISEDEN